MALTDGDLLDLLEDTATSIAAALGQVTDWGLAGTRAGQHHSDLVADQAALAVLAPAGVGVLSEESGLRHADRPVVVVVDPLDGSTNAARGVPWYGLSLCAVDADGPRVGLVLDLPHRRRYEAVRGAGAWVSDQGGSGDRDGSGSNRGNGGPLALVPSGCTVLGEAVVGLSGWPRQHLGWKQFRALGAVALDLCAVAAGALDAFVDCSWSAHGPWDYLAGLLICQEAGAVVGDAQGRDLVSLDHEARRTPVAGATAELYAQALAARELA